MNKYLTNFTIFVFRLCLLRVSNVALYCSIYWYNLNCVPGRKTFKYRTTLSTHIRKYLEYLILTCYADILPDIMVEIEMYQPKILIFKKDVNLKQQCSKNLSQILKFINWYKNWIRHQIFNIISSCMFPFIHFYSVKTFL